MKKYKAIIYDWDGCLVQSLRIWVDAYQIILHEAGIERSSSDIMSCLGNWQAAELLGHPDPEWANQDIVAYVNEHITDAELYPNARKTITDLKNSTDMKVFIVTATKRQTAEATKAYVDIKPLIDFTVFADDVTKHKPDPEAINLVLDKFGLKTDEVLLVGDSANDVKAAQNAHIDSVWFAPPDNEAFHPYDKIASLSPTWRIQDHNEVITNCTQISLAF